MDKVRDTYFLKSIFLHVKGGKIDFFSFQVREYR